MNNRLHLPPHPIRPTTLAIPLLAFLIGMWMAPCPAQQEETSPSPTPSSTAEKAPHLVEIDLTDGSHLVGTVPAETTFLLQSADIKTEIAIKWIDAITVSDDHKTVTLTMQNGDSIQGALDIKPMELTMIVGKVTVDPRFIKAITVSEMDEPDVTAGLVFWNTLANEKEALKSKMGPALAPYNGGGINNSGIELAGQRDFLAGTRTGAMMLKGDYRPSSRVHNLVLDGLDKLINPEQGCIEFWYCQAGRPVAYQYGVYRMFDGDYGLGASAQFCTTAEGLVFSLDCGGGRQSVTCPLANVPDKEWIHVAATWNAKGIEGTQDTIRIYINDKKIAVSNASGWGDTPSGKADIGGGNDAQCAGKFLISNLKIWNRTKTNFDSARPPDVDPKKLQEIKDQKELKMRIFSGMSL